MGLNDTCQTQHSLGKGTVDTCCFLIQHYSPNLGTSSPACFGEPPFSTCVTWGPGSTLVNPFPSPLPSPQPPLAPGFELQLQHLPAMELILG